MTPWNIQITVYTLIPPITTKIVYNYLSICKNGGIISVQAAQHEVLDTWSIHLILEHVRVEDQVEGEGLVLAEGDLGLVGNNRCAHPAHVDHLPRNLGPNTAKKLNNTIVETCQRKPIKDWIDERTRKVGVGKGRRLTYVRNGTEANRKVWWLRN